MVIQASVVNADRLFNLNGLEYPKAVYESYYDRFEVDDSGNPIEDTVSVGIRNKYTKEVLVPPMLPTSYNNGTTDYASLDALMADLPDLLGFNLAGTSALKTGFLDYNNASSPITLVADTWTDVPNDGAGAFTNKVYPPSGVTELLDVSTGYLDFSQLSIGDQILVRNDITINPSTNNSLIEVRYVLGQGAGEYALSVFRERLDSGSGIDYQKVFSFPIYMGDENTRGGEGKLQVKISTSATLSNAGSYINIQKR